MTTFQKENQFYFEVSDTGEGIHPDDQLHIFNRFYQSQNSHQTLQGGTGVGLALSKELAQLLGGDITFKSEWKKGSTFTFSVPLELVEHTALANVIDEGTHPTPFVPTYQPIAINGEKPKILIVEDNLEMSKYLVEILSNDYECTTAADGEEALKQLKLYHFDAITSDVMMPNIDGFELRERINQNQDWRQIPFLLLTARHLESDKLRGFQLGIDDYVTKPFSTKELQARIHNLISNKIERDHYIQSEQSELANETLSVDQQFLKQCEQVVLENIDKTDFKVDDLAKAVNYSAKQTGRIIKKLTGLSSVNFILEVRLQKARELLEKGLVASVIEAQMEVGIASTSYFTRKFTERFGKNPSEVRR
jgi:DNA-binding response OmpR family regulator